MGYSIEREEKKLGKVKKLDKTVADKIAAGEVIERPASVVKEMVENSMDAGAGNITINLEEGGNKLIHISDDGWGMEKEDALLALERFATSKITDWEDLEGLKSFGFRGEALPSICAVSRMEIITRTKEASSGIRIIAEGGEVLEVSQVGASQGTSIKIRDIFFNTPARRKFLKSASAETSHILSMVQKLALVNQEISFSVNVGGENC